MTNLTDNVNIMLEIFKGKQTGHINIGCKGQNYNFRKGNFAVDRCACKGRNNKRSLTCQCVKSEEVHENLKKKREQKWNLENLKFCNIILTITTPIAFL